MIRNLNVHHATSNEIMVTWEPPQNNDVESYKVTRQTPRQHYQCRNAQSLRDSPLREYFKCAIDVEKS